MRLILTPYDLAVLRPPAVAAAPPGGLGTPTFVSVSGFGPASAGASNSINAPAGIVDGDVLIWAMRVDRTTSTLTMPTGWTLINTQTISSQLFNTYIKVANGEPASYSFQFAPSAFTSIVIAAFRDVDTATPIDDATINTAASTTSTATGVTTGNDNTMLVMASMTTGTRNYTASDLTERYDDLGNLGLFTGLQAAAGASGNKTATISSSATWGAQLIALRPAGGV